MKLIVGLGNPGKQYEMTRHNAGFLAIDALAKALAMEWRLNKKLNVLLAKDGKMALAKPLSYMNDSGDAVKKILSFYKLLPENSSQAIVAPDKNDMTKALTVIHDDIDIKLGNYKISLNSRGGGHKGVQSIIDQLKTKKFLRIRIGIKTEGEQLLPTEKFVLEKFTAAEYIILKETIDYVVAEITSKFLSIKN